MGQAVWTGSISFGLVNIPVRLYPATEPKDVRFHLYDRRTGKRVRYERVTRAEDVPAFEPDPSSRILSGGSEWSRGRVFGPIRRRSANQRSRRKRSNPRMWSEAWSSPKATS